jgi:hypothetical protein
MKNNQGQVLSTGKPERDLRVYLGSIWTFNPVVKTKNVGETNHAFKPPGCNNKKVELVDRLIPAASGSAARVSSLPLKDKSSLEDV